MSDVAASTSAQRRRRAFIAIGSCVAAIVAIIVLGVMLSENVVYFRSVSEAVRDRKEQGTDRFRIAGEVVPGSVTETARGVRFEIADNKATAVIVHRGDPPELFDDNVPIVCEGSWGSGEAFLSDRILIKHGNEYKPPEVDAAKKDAGK